MSERKQKLREMISKSKLLDERQMEDLLNLITCHHAAFSLDSQNRGETDLIEMEIHTGEEAPRKVSACRMPFAVRQEVAKQLHNMQEGE